MPNYSKNDVILVNYPFSNSFGSKVRPAVVINAAHASQDVMIVPLTSRLSPLFAGEFVLSDWKSAGLNVASATKRGIYTLHQSLILKTVGKLSGADAACVERSLREWLGLK